MSLPEFDNTISVVTGHVDCEYRFPDRDSEFVKVGVGERDTVDGNFFPGGYRVYESQTDIDKNELGLLPHAVIRCLLYHRVDNEQSQLEYKNNSKYLFRLRGSSGNRGLRDHLPYITFQVGELPRQAELRMVTVHAAAMVSPDGIGILVLGDKGAGKTSVCIELGIGRDYGLLGNNLVIVENSDKDKFLRLVSGTHVLAVREATLASIPALAKVNRGLSLVDEETHGRENKIMLTPEKLGIKTAEPLSEIGAVIRVNIHPRQPEAICVSGVSDGLTERLRLFENFSRYIRGVTTPLALTETHISGHIPSLDSPILSSMRNQLIERLLKLPFYYISGNSVAAVTEKIDLTVKSI
jgi:hypothetical protein